MRRGGTAIWKAQIFYWLLILTTVVIWLFIKKINNYKDLWRWRSTIELRLQEIENDSCTKRSSNCKGCI